jgi:hypothetical protein
MTPERYLTIVEFAKTKREFLNVFLCPVARGAGEQEIF